MSDKHDGDVADLTVRILGEIRDEAKKTNERLDQTNERLDGLQVEVHELRSEMHQGFNLLGRRFDNLLLGEHREEHESLRGRVDRIERHLGLDSG